MSRQDSLESGTQRNVKATQLRVFIYLIEVHPIGSTYTHKLLLNRLTDVRPDSPSTSHEVLAEKL